MICKSFAPSIGSRRLKPWARLALALLFVFPLLPGPASAFQTDDPRQKALELAARLTPEEKVGQLALVTFEGAQAPPESQIYELVTQYHVGGVVLRRENDNLVDSPETAPALLALVNQLQTGEYDDSQQPRVLDPGSEATTNPAYIPLLVGLEQPGDGPPISTILSGVTTFPSALAIGATWNPTRSEQMGALLGQELALLGINLLLGPDLDVLETPAPGQPGDLGTRTFGGDPFWVGEMGEAYVRGLRSGSEGRLAVFARHFPGLGSSNRQADVEVPTVRRTLDELKQVELFPFFAVTGDSLNLPSAADGLVTAHIRFQGLQGNIRATTRPVSFDPQALQLLTTLPQLAEWRAGGGLLMSESLGTVAVRRFYDAGYSGRLVARDALLAGNDLLYLSDFQSPNDPDPFTTVVETLSFFAERYEADGVFAQRVDEALLRALQLKFRLFPNFAPELVLKSGTGLESLGQAQADVFSVAQEAATLIHPRSPAELDERLPDAPQQGESVTFITDVRTYLQCSGCAPFAALRSDSLQQAVLRLYGVQGSEQVRAEDLQSFSYEDLTAFLDGTAVPLTNEEGTPQGPIPIEAALLRSRWVIFSQQDLDEEVPWSSALKRLLAERPQLVRDKRLVVFAFGAPYYLDATEITSLTAYFGLYSQAPPFVDYAARLLFREESASGDSPVSVPGAGYDLFTITQPDPNQIIPLAQESEPPQAVPGGLVLGDQVILRAGPILDHNGHLVPDGTVVRFSEIRGAPPELVEQTTVNGLAHATFRLERVGEHEFRASTDTARVSENLLIDIPLEGIVFFTEVAPTPAPTLTEIPTATPTLAPTSTAVILPTQPPEIPTVEPPRITFGDLLLALMVGGGLASLAYRLGREIPGWHRAGWWLALTTAVGSLAGYDYIALQMPGSEAIQLALAGWSSFLLTLLGGSAGLGLGWIWLGREGLPREQRR